MSVRTLAPDADLAPWAAIHAACFSRDAWNAGDLRDLLAAPGTFAIVADAGFVLARIAADEAEILTLAVAPAGRRAGIATELVVAAANYAERQGAKALFLEVGVANEAARALYARLGFREAGRRKGYYARAGEVAEDALILRGNLPLQPLGKALPSG